MITEFPGLWMLVWIEPRPGSIVAGPAKVPMMTVQARSYRLLIHSTYQFSQQEGGRKKWQDKFSCTLGPSSAVGLWMVPRIYRCRVVGVNISIEMLQATR
jgi:hypothetical protein